MSLAIKGLMQGGSIPVDREKARAYGLQWGEANLSRQANPEPRPVAAARADYSAAYNSTAGAPVSVLEGVETAYGRVWAEARSIVHSGGSGSVSVALLSTQNGVRAIVSAPVGRTITSGSVRFWNFDPVTQLWALGTIDEALTGGSRSAATSDQFMTVGAQ